MDRSTRYLSSILIGLIVVGGSTVVVDSLLLLIAIGQTYTVGVALFLREETYNAMKSDKMVNANIRGIFVGVAVFGVVSTAQSVSDDFHYGALILTFGLCMLGYISGVSGLLTSTD
jgi:hypothetical protein